MTKPAQLRTAPPRGFDLSEFEARAAKAQKLMAAAGFDALLLMTEPEFRYFSGFHTQFWESPTRPWFLVVPAKGKPIAVVPEIGVAGFAGTWIEDVRAWPAPRPEDDGISLLSDLLSALATVHGRVALPMGPETQLRMPAADFLDLRDRLGGIEFADATDIVRALRGVKSEAEIDKIRYVCQLVSDGFEALPAWARAGMSEREICQRLRGDLIARGSDGSPYLIGVSGPGGYNNIIMGPTDRTIEAGDLLIIDTGTTFDGYFCDFDRNFAFGRADDAAKRAYDVAYKATEAGLAAARPGTTTAELAAAMWAVLEEGGALGNDVGRLGHGLGMQLTEPPSNRPGDTTVLQPGMVMTLEPGMCFQPGKLMVHEENIVIRDGAPEVLTRRAAPDLPIVRP